ncbi:MAG TPA: glycosyltransferase [Polyangiaceae bacterium]|nr:glycosyltransferase [Polyangiaceae bacterium]
MIHQTWKTRDIPEHLRAFQRSVVEHHPGWEVRLWTDEENRAFIDEHYPWFSKTYAHYPYEIMRVDAVRPFLLQHYGGFYVDLDVECLGSFETLRRGELASGLIARRPTGQVGLVLGLERRLTRTPVCTNAVMASRPQHPLWQQVFEALELRARRKQPWFMPRENYILNTTGPELIHGMLRKHSHEHQDVLVVTPEVLSPLGWWQHRDGRDFSSAIAVHHYGSSWLPTHSLAWQNFLRAIAG